ncbi:hypothetical protein ADL26_01430 [Thermoactinomyces vulgaris]|jgi:hypothetical protein|nr:hypothetical protein ADL26_01430 [Thermoactinomyces vulgaris]
MKSLLKSEIPDFYFRPLSHETDKGLISLLNGKGFPGNIDALITRSFAVADSILVNYILAHLAIWHFNGNQQPIWNGKKVMNLPVRHLLRNEW